MQCLSQKWTNCVGEKRWSHLDFIKGSDAVTIEKNQQGAIDLLEIYHARQVRDQIIAQLRRLRCTTQQLPLHEQARRRELRGYYEALLLTVAELQDHVGDEQTLH